MKTPESRWEKPSERILLPDPPSGEWCGVFYQDEIPEGYRPVLEKENVRKGDYGKGHPHIDTGQIWYMIHVDQKYTGKAITQRPLPLWCLEASLCSYSGSHFSWKDKDGVVHHVKEPSEEQLEILKGMTNFSMFSVDTIHDEEYNIHYDWHHIPKYDPEKGGYAYSKELKTWAADKPRVRWFGVDDAAFMSAIIFLIPSMSKWQSMGVNVLYVPQLGEPLNFFCYPHHLKNLLKAFTDISTILHSLPFEDKASPRYLEKEDLKRRLLNTVHCNSKHHEQP